MPIVHLMARADEEGCLRLDVPDSMRDRDIQITLTTPEPSMWDNVPRDALGWPNGFWEHYAGSMPDFPEDPEDPPAEDVDPL